MTRVQSHVMLVLYTIGWNHQMWEKKLREPPNVTKELLNVMLELYIVRIELSNVRKNKKTTKCGKRIITCDIGTTQYEDETLNMMFW